MRRPAALILAASFFTLSSLLAQAQTSQTQAQTGPTQSSSSEKSAQNEKSQTSEKADSSTAKAESAPTQENPFDKFQQFSATVSGGPLRFDKMPIYRSGNKIRADWANEHEIRVSDLSQGIAWYMRHWPGKPEKCGRADKMDIGSYPFFAYTGKDFKVELVPNKEPAEKETYDGHPSKIEHYTATKISEGLLVAKVKMWEAEDLNGFPVRMEIDPPLMKPFNLYYSNVSLGPPDPKLFQVPAKCLKEKTDIKKTPSPKSKSSKPVASQKSDKNSAPPQ